jgi:hypothetical protein
MGKRCMVACMIGFSLALSAAVRADTMAMLPYWPGDGIWLYYSTDASAIDADFWVYCGPGCVEFSSANNIPPAPLEQWVHDPVNHNSYLDRPYVYGQIEHDGGGETTWDGQAIAAWDCGDARSALDQEYVDTYSGGSMYFVLGMLPHCTWVDGDFNSSGGSTNFSWSEVNGGFSQGNPNYPWGIVRTSLYIGLEQTRTNYNRGGISLSSGYRTPSGNANVGGVFGSYHVRGRAADMYSSSNAWTEDEFNLMRQAAADTGNTVELLSWNTYTDHHLHAAW